MADESPNTKTGRASARKRREEKLQQQTRRRSQAARSRTRDRAAAGKAGKSAAPQVSTVEMSATKKRIRVDESISVADLAHQMGLKAARILRTLWSMDMRGVKINDSIDVETAELIAAEFGYSVENVSFDEGELIGADREAEDAPLRAPVVTVMGHVDHGKTTLLDRIRGARVVEGEAGGITQHMGAHRVETPQGPIVFLDTPGHAAFTAMRSRGAQLTDIVVLVIAADDGVMPTTIEAIKLARESGVSLVVWVNKIDSPQANSDRVKQMLMGAGVVGEEFGGDVAIVEGSAKTGAGVDKLLELLALQAELLNLRASTRGRATGTVLEARIQKGRGSVATVLVESGSLAKGDIVVAGEHSGHVRNLAGQSKASSSKAAFGPSTIVELLGLDGVPDAGTKCHVVESEQDAKQLVAHRVDARRRQIPAREPVTILDRLKTSSKPRLGVVLRCDVAGSAEAIAAMLRALATPRVEVEVISSAVGGISENDVALAQTSEAVIFGFNAKPVGKAARAAQAANVRIFQFNVVYELEAQARELMIDLLPVEHREQHRGRAEVRQVFAIPSLGKVCGCRVVDGRVTRSCQIRVERDADVVHTGRVQSLRVVKEDVKTVGSGFECGIVVEGWAQAEVGDVLVAYELETIRPTL